MIRQRDAVGLVSHALEKAEGLRAPGQLERGPIVPPANPNAPYRPRLGPGRTPGVEGLSGGPRSPAFRFVRRDATRTAP